MKSIPVPVWDEMMDYWRCHVSVHWVTSFWASGSPEGSYHWQDQSSDQRSYRSSSQPKQNEQRECCAQSAVLLSSTADRTDTTKSTSTLQFPSGLTLIMQRSHSWFKISKCCNSSNTNSCILERFVKGKNPKCFLAVLKPHKNQIKPIYEFLRAAKSTLWPYQRIKPENRLARTDSTKPTGNPTKQLKAFIVIPWIDTI